MDLNKAIKERHSVKNFKLTKKVDWKDVIKSVDAANYAPLAGNIQTLRFILVSDRKKIQALAVPCQQSFVAKADYIVVVCSELAQIKRAYKERAEKYSKQQAGAAIENFLLEITNLELGCCWVGAFDDEEVKRILEIPDDVEVEALLPVGYEIGKGKQNKKTDLDNVLFFDKWKNKYMKPKEPSTRV